MKKVKYRTYLDYEKEEKWINEMAAQGWHLKKWFMGRFTFTKGEPGAYIYRNELISGMSIKEKKEYFEFLKDSGVTIVHELGWWVYMKKPAADGPFELYSDTGSKIAYYKRMLNIFLLLFFVNIGPGISNLNVLNNRSLGFFNSYVGYFNLALALLIAVPLIKIIQRIRELKGRQQFFE